MVPLEVKILGVLGLCLLFYGCTDLKVYRVNTKEPQKQQFGQIPYYLPRTTITVTGTLTLKACETEVTAGGATLKLLFDKAIIATPAVEADPAYQFFLDYEKTRNISKEINFTVDTYPNKTMQAFSSTMNDQAGPIAAAVVSMAVNVAAAIAV